MKLFFRKKFNPDLIDLVQYEKDLLYYQRHGILLPPPVSIPQLSFGDWNDSEMQAMRDNREKAQKLYDVAKIGML